MASCIVANTYQHFGGEYGFLLQKKKRDREEEEKEEE
jgi:hypothetical protein